MSFRERIDLHLKQFPFDPIVMFSGDKTAYGMFLFQEQEYLIKNKKIIFEFLNIKKFIPHYESVPSPDLVDFVVLWGVSEVDPNAELLFNFAHEYSKPVLIIEDGFLRSFYPMPYGEVSASMRMDFVGCYYDSHYPSSIENLLNSEKFELSEFEKIEISGIIQKIVKGNVTKYNLSKDYVRNERFRNYKHKVLVIDQVYGDMSVKKGGVADEDFSKILDAAITENPDSLIIVKLHPEAVLGIRKGHFEENLVSRENIEIITDEVNPISILKEVDKVYCATTQMGFEALLCEKEVVCFGKPFYAGWGLTDDRKFFERRFRTRGVEEVFYAAYLFNTIYLNPKTKTRSDLKTVVDYFVETKTDSNHALKLRNDYLELRIRRLESKILEVEPLKEASIKFHNAIKKLEFDRLNDNFFYRNKKRLARVMKFFV